MRDLKNLFSYHPPKPAQIERYNRIRTAALTFATVIEECCPDSADADNAIDQVSMASMLANRFIACEP